MVWLWFCTAFILTSCKQDSDLPESTKFAEIKTPQSFDWSSVRNLIINITVNEGNDGLLIELRDVHNQVIDKERIFNGKARFNVRISTHIREVEVVCVSNNQRLRLPADNSSEFLQLDSTARLNWLAAPDNDGDGIPNLWDDFPSDATRAFRLRVPYVGEHYLLFDDMWPVQGDHDFNDVVLGNTYIYTYNADKRLLQGQMNVRLIALSAEQPLGLGVELFTSIAGSTFSYPFGNAATFDGVTADDSVPNCALLIPNLREFQSSPYTNDGKGPSKKPDQLSFSFAWNAAIGGDLVWPNFFLYKPTNRSYEIHAFGYPPTFRADFSLFASGDDASISRWRWVSSFLMPNAFYRSYRNLPWGMEFFHENFAPVVDGADFAQAYIGMVNWAESAGLNNLGWRDFPDNRKVLRVPN